MTIYGYTLVLLLITSPILFNFINKKLLNAKYTFNDIAFLSSITVFIFFIAIQILAGYQSDVLLNSFDLNDDGVFSEEEMTPDFYKAMHIWTEDFGIGYTIVLGLLICSLYYKVLAIMFKKMKEKNIS